MPWGDLSSLGNSGPTLDEIEGLLQKTRNDEQFAAGTYEYLARLVGGLGANTVGMLEPGHERADQMRDFALDLNRRAQEIAPPAQGLGEKVFRHLPGVVGGVAEFGATLAAGGLPGVAAVGALRGSDEGVWGAVRGSAWDLAMMTPVAGARAATALMPASKPLTRLAVRAAGGAAPAAVLTGGDPGMTAINALVGAIGGPKGAPGRGPTNVPAGGSEALALRALEPSGVAAIEHEAPKALTRATPFMEGAPKRLYSVGTGQLPQTPGGASVYAALERAAAADPAHATVQPMEEVFLEGRKIARQITPGMSLREMAGLSDEVALSAKPITGLRLAVSAAGDAEAVAAKYALEHPGSETALADHLGKVAALDVLARSKGKAFQMSGRATRSLKELLFAGDPTTRLEKARALLPAGAPLEEIQKQMLMLPEPGQRAMFWRGLTWLGQKTPGGDFTDAMHTLFVNSILSGPRSQATNIMGNVGLGALTLGSQAGVAGVGALESGGRQLANVGRRALGREARPPVDRMYFREIPARLRAMKNSWGEASELSRRNFVTREEPAFLGESGTKASDLASSSRFLEDNLVLTAPTRGLSAMDVLSKVLLYRSGLEALGTRAGVRHGLRGRKLDGFVDEFRINPPEAAMAQAIKEAEYGTLTSELGEFGKTIQQLRDVAPTGRWQMPFFRTLVNLGKRGVEYGPAGPFTHTGREKILRGTNIERAEALTRSAIGTGTGLAAFGHFGAYVGGLYEEGRITGRRPQDQTEAALWEAKGIQEYSIKPYGSDRWIQYSKIAGPLGPTLGSMVDWYTSYEKAHTLQDKGLAESAALATIQAAYTNFAMPAGFMGAMAVTNVMEEPERYLPRFLEQWAGSAVPGIVRQVAQAQDPRKLETRGMGQAVARNVPGLRSLAEGKYNPITGEQVGYEPALGGSSVSPIFTSTEKNRPLFDVLEKVGARVSTLPRNVEISIGKRDPNYRRMLELEQDESLSPRQRALIRRTLTGGASIQLKPKHYSLINRLAGQRASAQVEAEADSLLAMDADPARDRIAKIYEDARRNIRDKMVKPFYLRTLFGEKLGMNPDDFVIPEPMTEEELPQ